MLEPLVDLLLSTILELIKAHDYKFTDGQLVSLSAIILETDIVKDAYQKYKDGSLETRPYREFRQELVKEGKLD